MKNEKTFTVVGTSVDPNGVLKVRWTNDLYWRVKVFTKRGHTNINLHETPRPMTKLEAVEWLKENVELSDFEDEAVTMKIYEKKKQQERYFAKVKMISNINESAKIKTPVDPLVENFVSKELCHED